MAQTMKIKRSTGTGKPSSVAQGELFYAYGSGGTYGKRLSIGHVDGGGNTPEIIGGSFFTDMLDHTAGTLTASSAVLVDSGGYIDEVKVKAQGAIKLHEATANGVNYVGLKAPATVGSDLVYTLPAAAVDGRFLSTDASGVLAWTAIATSFDIGADSGSDDSVTLGETLNFTGTANEIETSVSGNQITIGMPNNVTITGNLTVNGTTTTISTTNTTVEDALLELGTGTSGTPANDAGIVIERGSADNAFFGWDESIDKFVVGTGSFTGASTGDLTIATATLLANLESSSVAITGGSITGITDITVADGGTGLSAVAKGSILAANTANVLSAVDGGGSTDKFLLYTAASDTVSWTNTVDGGTYS
tara:strand:+ start:8 stop:1096 length:1089 start_codon:yes stop_codon:yes gene_type:complete